MEEQPYNFLVAGEGTGALEVLGWIRADPKPGNGTYVGLVYDRIITPTFFNVIGTVAGAKALDDYNADSDERLVVVCDNPSTKSKLIDAIHARHGKFVGAIHSSVKIGEFCAIGAGVIIAPNAVIGSGSTIGAFAQIESGCTIADGAVIGALSRIGPGLTIGRNATIARSSLIRENLPDREIPATAAKPSQAALASPKERSPKLRGLAFDDVWPEIVNWLKAEPTAPATNLFERLRRKYPERFGLGQIESFRKRVATWRGSKSTGRV